MSMRDQRRSANRSNQFVGLGVKSLLGSNWRTHVACAPVVRVPAALTMSGGDRG
jgi:hypothetical protein